MVAKGKRPVKVPLGAGVQNARARSLPESGLCSKGVGKRRGIFYMLKINCSTQNCSVAFSAGGVGERGPTTKKGRAASKERSGPLELP